LGSQWRFCDWCRSWIRRVSLWSLHLPRTVIRMKPVRRILGIRMTISTEYIVQIAIEVGILVYYWIEWRMLQALVKYLELLIKLESAHELFKIAKKKTRPDIYSKSWRGNLAFFHCAVNYEKLHFLDTCLIFTTEEHPQSIMHSKLLDTRKFGREQF